MPQTNPIQPLFGPSGAMAGKIVMAAGLLALFTSYAGIILILAGAFAGFSCTATTVDFDRRSLRFSTAWFGLLKSGPWTEVNDSMKLAVVRSNVSWRVYSQGNRATETTSDNFYVVLMGSQGEQIMPVKKVRNAEAANSEIEILCSRLGLSKSE